MWQASRQLTTTTTTTTTTTGATQLRGVSETDQTPRPCLVPPTNIASRSLCGVTRCHTFRSPVACDSGGCGHDWLCTVNGRMQRAKSERALELREKGLMDGEIAEALGVSRRTVQRYLRIAEADC